MVALVLTFKIIVMKSKVLNSLFSITLLFVLVIYPYKAQASPFIGSETTEGDCSYTGGCGSSATGIQLVTTTFYLFGIPLSSSTSYESCSPSPSLTP
jgi:hypothetical protein